MAGLAVVDEAQLPCKCRYAVPGRFACSARGQFNAEGLTPSEGIVAVRHGPASQLNLPKPLRLQLR